MKRLPLDQLSPSQRIILSCVEATPGEYNRSALAKVLVGSQSSRVMDYAEQPFFGALSDHGRKSVTFEIDILIQQGLLEHDPLGRLRLAPTSL